MWQQIVVDLASDMHAVRYYKQYTDHDISLRLHCNIRYIPKHVCIILCKNYKSS